MISIRIRTLANTHVMRLEIIKIHLQKSQFALWVRSSTVWLLIQYIYIFFTSKDECEIVAWEPNDRKITVKSHDTTKWSVFYRGYPKVVGEFRDPNGNIINNSPEFKCTFRDYPGLSYSIATLEIHNTMLQQSGDYTFFLTNDVCNSTENVTVNVSGKYKY